jgi:hypothetical protein
VDKERRYEINVEFQWDFPLIECSIIEAKLAKQIALVYTANQQFLAISIIMFCISTD